MAKKSKAQQIRSYLAATPLATTSEVAKKFGVKLQYVYVIRSLLKKEKKKVGVNIDSAHTRTLTVPPEATVVATIRADMVNHPPHYVDGGVETIDFIEAKKLDYHLGNVVKYITRAGKKDDELQDLKKARWYLDRAISARHETVINCDGPV